MYNWPLGFCFDRYPVAQRAPVHRTLGYEASKNAAEGTAPETRKKGFDSRKFIEVSKASRNIVDCNVILELNIVLLQGARSLRERIFSFRSSVVFKARLWF